MSSTDFVHLHSLVDRRLQKQKTHLRAPLTSDLRLALTLHYLGHGGSVISEAHFFRIGKSTAFKIIAETCECLSNILMPLYVRLPNEAEWLKIAYEFNEKWNFPNCVGALDGKHIRLSCPSHGGNQYFNYKKFHSIVLMAVCDANNIFTWFSIGDYGSYSDANVFAHTDFAKKLHNNDFNLPQSCRLPNSNISVPYCFVSDEIFPLSKNLMNPYSRKNINSLQNKVFNYRLSRARDTIECAFGILSRK